MIDPQDTLTEGEQREIRRYIRSTLGGPEVPRDELPIWLVNLIDRAERAESDNAQLRNNLAETGEILAINRRAVRELNDKLVDLKASSNAEADQFNAGYEAGEKGGLDPFADQPHYEPDYDSWRNGYYAGSYDRLVKELADLKAILSEPEAVHRNILLGRIAIPYYYVRTTDTSGEFAKLERELVKLKERNKRLMEKFAYWDSDVDFCCIHCGEFNSTREGIVHDANYPMLPEPPEKNPE